ncbi:clusterin-associated protein 1 isoform X2 [Bicyclus anynana]|uniref:Clusterin-associated protein 1 isoform X2 n=1 Tax=Bicyclus anynana TaxID=110368 RepID=A0ABM3LM81_BICAN|nr:clusterin-associated protein 1 isoform X2 [Bicyclus anynana]
MSYRDLRNFSEAMRALGFPQQISVESFRSPNWALVEECLRWLAARVEPDAALAGGRGSVEQRVAMVTHATELFHSRANLTLNGKKLYGADGWAVRELLKVAGLLRATLRAPADEQHADADPLLYDVSGRVSEIKQARALATDITAQGAFLYDLLAKEPENKEQRDKALSRPLDMSSLEAALSRALAALAARVAALREQIDSVASSEAALDAKLERRRAELQRAEKRLHTVQKIKPAYQGELTALEIEIEDLWEQYVLRYRCVEALKHQLSLLETAQAEAAEEQQAAIMQLIHKYEAEDVLGKLSDSDESESSDEGKESAKQPRPATRPKTRLRIKTAGVGPDARHAFGSMQARDELRDLDDSSDSDLTDTQLYAGEGAGGGRWSRPRPATRTLAPADDYADLVHGGKAEGSEASEGSLGSSSESELRLTSAHPGRTSALSDNEF